MTIIGLPLNLVALVIVSRQPFTAVCMTSLSVVPALALYIANVALGILGMPTPLHGGVILLALIVPFGLSALWWELCTWWPTLLVDADQPVDDELAQQAG